MGDPFKFIGRSETPKRSGPMRPLLAWLAILGALPFVIRAGLNGSLSAEQAAILLVLFVVALALRVRLSRIVIPVAGVLVLAAQYSHGDPKVFQANLGALLALSLAMLGIYIMIPKRRRRQD